MSAERVAERIGALSGGRLEITVSAAGEVVPAFEVLAGKSAGARAWSRFSIQAVLEAREG